MVASLQIVPTADRRSRNAEANTSSPPPFRSQRTPDNAMSKKSSSGKTVVMLHGWGGSSRSVWKENGWTGQLQAAGLDPVGIDLLGHGDAQHPHDPESYSDLAASVIERLPQSSDGLLGLGYSLGCKVLLEIESRLPGTFQRMVLGGLGGNAFAPEGVGASLADCLRFGPRPDTPPAVKALAEYGVAAGNDPLALAACLCRPPNPRLTKRRLSTIRCPVLLVCGDEDMVALPVEPLVDALPNPATLMLEGVDHLALPQSLQFRQAAVAFLARTSAAVTATTPSIQ